MLVFAFYRTAWAALRPCALRAEMGKQVFKIEITRAERFAALKFVAEAARTFLRAVETASGRVGQHVVVFGTLSGIGQGFIGAVDFGGPLGSIGFFADIGMVFAHQFAIGLFYGVGICRFVHAEYVVIVFFCHFDFPYFRLTNLRKYGAAADKSNSRPQICFQAAFGEANVNREK